MPREAVAVSKAVGVTTLDGLTDVAITSAATGDVLRYNGTAWVDAVLAIADTSGLQSALNAKLGGSLGSTDNRVLRADGTGGSTAQGSVVTIDDSGNVTGIGTLVASGTITAPTFSSSSGFTTFDTVNGSRMELGTSSSFSSVYWGRPATGITRAFGWTDSTQLFSVRSGGGFAWGSNTDASASITTTVSQASAGVVQIGTTANNALGSLNLANLTASGTISTTQSNIVSARNFQVSDGYGLAASGSNQFILFSGSNQVWATNGLLVRLANGSTPGPVDCGNLTASGLIGLGTYTVATLPSASANAGRIAQVTDSSVTTNGSAVSSGGSNRVMVFSNGTTWDVVVA